MFFQDQAQSLQQVFGCDNSGATHGIIMGTATITCSDELSRRSAELTGLALQQRIPAKRRDAGEQL
jgi:hypothetical protein